MSVASLTSEIDNLYKKLNEETLSKEEKQKILDIIKEKQRMIEKSSKSEQLIIDIPAKTIKERKNNPSIRMTENRYIL